jgi:septal ring factor EnvC (AmiA/AmiB activator)
MLFNKIQNLKKSSQAILDVFTKTQEDLQKVNDAILEEKEIRNKKITESVGEVMELDNLQINNHKVITKIEKFLNE